MGRRPNARGTRASGGASDERSRNRREGSPREAATDAAAIYLDVRTVAEYDQGHPDGAWNIPILEAGPRGMTPNPLFGEVAAAALPRQGPILVGCRSGQRSRMACQLLSELGFQDVANVAGGYSGATDPTGRVLAPGWADSGLPTSTEPTPGKSWKELRTI